MTAGGFHTPGNSKICFFCLIYDLNIIIFLLDIIYAKHHINAPQKSKIKLLYITFWPPRKILVVGFEHVVGYGVSYPSSKLGSNIGEFNYFLVSTMHGF